MRELDEREIFFKLAILYFIIIGLMLVILDFILPLLYPPVEPYIGRINDIFIVMITPLISLMIVRKELEQYRDKKDDRVKEIIIAVEQLSNPYGQEDFEHKKDKILMALRNLQPSE